MSRDITAEEYFSLVGQVLEAFGLDPETTSSITLSSHGALANVVDRETGKVQPLPVTPGSVLFRGV